MAAVTHVTVYYIKAHSISSILKKNMLCSRILKVQFCSYFFQVFKCIKANLKEFLSLRLIALHLIL